MSPVLFFFHAVDEPSATGSRFSADVAIVYFANLEWTVQVRRKITSIRRYAYIFYSSVHYPRTTLTDSRGRLKSKAQRSPFQTLSCLSSVATASARPCTHLIAVCRAIPCHRPRHSYVGRDDIDSVASTVTSIVTSVTHPLCVIVSLSPAQAGLVKKKVSASSRSGGVGENKN